MAENPPVSTRSGEEYTVLARRYRPQGFREVIGQEMTAQALKNAILGGRVAHAYLFTGARGVGKTSTARILAKALNCPNAVDAEPCNQCEICEGISSGNDVDVLEIDGASNRGIDDIRLLRSNVNVRSMRTKYKVYIIDEVHMLTKDAFNALLKTLEEPPPNVKFVFCTTEPGKIPDTILSRCQRFDFGTIETARIKARLGEIAEREGRTVSEEALETVARRAAGSMRDSQSLFDQLLAFGGETISAEDVHRLLGTAPDVRLIELFEALSQRRLAEALNLLDRFVESGVQIGELADQMVRFLRDLAVLSAGASVTLMSVFQVHREKIQQLSQKLGPQRIASAFEIVIEMKARMQRSAHGRAILEMALMRLGSLEDLESILESISQVRSSSGPPVRPVQRLTPQPVRDGGKELKTGAVPGPPKVESHQQNQPSERVELAPGKEKAFWTQVVANIPDMLRAHAERGELTASSAPNHLVLSFPKSYDLSRQYCSRADNLARLQEFASKLAGESIRLSIIANLDSVLPNLKGKPEKEELSHPFLKKAVEIFGGRIDKPPKT